MNRIKVLLFAACWMAVFIPLLAQTNAAPQHNKSAKHASQSANADDSDRGQQVFQQNCSRCHNAPQGFSPRISGTVLRHMRVRASLSAADEKALLRFMNP
jgi:mono/diheme cytochrome c family protein